MNWGGVGGGVVAQSSARVGVKSWGPEQSNLPAARACLQPDIRTGQVRSWYQNKAKQRKQYGTSKCGRSKSNFSMLSLSLADVTKLE